LEAKVTQFRQCHERHTDVMHIDLLDAPPDARVDVVEVGADIGFPGQLLVRVDRDSRTMLGITILQFSSFQRRLRWTYRIASVQKALLLLVNLLRAGMHTGGSRPALGPV
jgi:hypothetical protein